MQALLNDIELDIQELKCLVQAISVDSNPALRIVAKRNIHQMQEKLNTLTELLNETFVITPQARSVNSVNVEPVHAQRPVAEQPPIETSVTSEPTPVTATSASPILGERIKPVTDLRHAISLNDLFRFTRELFSGDAARMNEVVRQLGGELLPWTRH